MEMSMPAGHSPARTDIGVRTSIHRVRLAPAAALSRRAGHSMQGFAVKTGKTPARFESRRYPESSREISQSSWGSSK
jgi:hypothetical protein